MPTYHYHLADVFTSVRFGGNPLAVFPPQAHIPSDALMQQIAKELSLSETAFVLPPADPANTYRVRIFTPAVELPMAGHPTIGTAFVLAKLGLVDVPSQITFEEGVGVIRVGLAHDAHGQVVATMQQPMPTFGEIVQDRAGVAALLSLDEAGLIEGLPLQVVSTGVPFLFVPIKDLATIANAKLRLDLWEQQFSRFVGLFLFTPHTQQAGVTVHSRMFGPGVGIPEDAATGGASGPLGAYLVRYGLAQAGTILSEQGIEMGRPSLIQIEISHDGGEFTRVAIGGSSVYIGRGELVLE
ncbi:MAG: PhzF family phenazine biosynthesis protein [Phototrophicaceae bacterium]|jgi:trans-2,3-dihydro-3-hydroxyanthranilate isomerase